MITETKAVDIILVEDSAEDAEIALAGLRARRLGDKAVHLMGGEQVLDFICANSWSAQPPAEEAPKLILLDLQLSDMNGLEVLQQLKVRDRTRAIPVVILTGSDSKTDMWACYRHGANSYVVKPSNPAAYSKLVGDIAYYWLVVNRSFY
jgi:CheY-like chemotaxis protein